MRSTSAGVPFLKDSYLSGCIGPRSSFLESWTEYTFPVLWIHAHCMPSPIFLLLCPYTYPLAVAAPAAGFSSCISREEKCFSRVLRSKYRSANFSVWCSLGTHLLGCYLECTAMAQDAVTVEADDDYLLSQISPSGCFFIALVASSHGALNDCMLSLFNSTKSKTGSQDRFVCVADLERLACDLPSHERALCSWVKTLLIVLETTRCGRTKKFEDRLQLRSDCK